ncbi:MULTISPECIES: DUF4249 family protein [unclassified Lentimicrobium]|uniref:DUF4249 family protein n=1 Tax=unclassified Lentimicrobium TaxID=2677434 RepID=UPI001551FD0F|nr:MULTISPECIES: DUF4249 family protein [unclassified Lentimicrobium]NPD46440.1 DUF4249 family protein [Lentimicrobium sp. S6]NPD84919.1 DUF4249 family protein [Lentimicrobium sp. L6]
MKNYFYIIFLAILFCTSCSKGIRFLEDYKEKVIVYGLIDPCDSISYIRIERAFFSEGNILEDAQVQDSNQFTYKLDVKLKQGNKTITFDTITIFNKEGGIFYAPKMLLYHAVTKDLLNTTDSLYLEIFNPKTKEFTTSSTILHDGDLIDFVYPVISIAFEHQYYIQFESLPNTRYYTLDLRFHYMEQTPGDNSSRRYDSIDWTFDPYFTQNSDGGEQVKFYQWGETFYDLVVEQVGPTEVLDRYFGNVELRITSGDIVLRNYFEANKPDHSVIGNQLQQYQYSNIKNGHGIFAARSGNGGEYILHLRTINRLRNIPNLNFIGGIPKD